MDYHVAFDLLDKGYQWWAPGVALFIALVGVSLLLIKKYKPGHVRFSYLRLWSGTVAAIGMFLLIFWITFANYDRYRHIYLTKQYQVVEGRVENFVPMPRTGNGRERFTVRGVTFEYSDFAATPGFNQTSAAGGPIQPGLQVRVSYTANLEGFSAYTILRLEIQK
jgi:hypothetical protein